MTMTMGQPASQPVIPPSRVQRKSTLTCQAQDRDRDSSHLMLGIQEEEELHPGGVEWSQEEGERYEGVGGVGW
jgi:hypothetical protein